MSPIDRFVPLDRWILIIGIGVWALCFGLGVKSTVRGVALTMAHVSAPEGPSDVPRVTGFLPLFDESRTALSVGDRLLELGDVDLRGVDPVSFQGILAEEVDANGRVRVVYERGGRVAATDFPSGSHRVFWSLLVVSLSWLVASVLLIFQTPRSPAVRSIFHVGLCFAIAWATAFGADVREQFVSFAVIAVTYTLAPPLAIRATQRFPHGRPPGGLFARAWPWLFALYGPTHIAANWGFLVPPETSRVVVLGVVVALNVALIAVALSNWLRCGPAMRRQMKWVGFGLYWSVVPSLAFSLVLLRGPRFADLWLGSLVVHALLPLSLLISVARYNLFDVDRLLSATASYNLLLIGAVALGLVTVPRLAGEASRVFGLDPSSGQVLIALPLAVAVVLGYRRVHPLIDRIFFRERFALEAGVRRLARRLARCSGPEALMRATGEGLHDLLRPASSAVYARANGRYLPVFVAGRGVPVSVTLTPSLVDAFVRNDGPLDVSPSGRSPGRPRISEPDRTTLDALGASVAMPILQHDRLFAFVSLGPKRSGDVYASTDLALLTVVARAVSVELARLEDAKLIRSSQAMQESLRRYVPGAVAEQIAVGEDPVHGERDVTVLFVDLRGYTQLSEGRCAAEIFSTVNRYTEAVSDAVCRHGGAVVEFNGDGMMAVFGAPRVLAHKERAAVAAGREILQAVPAIGIQEPARRGDRLAVGIGIASGSAFVGSIRAADRMLWSAIGNTTNRAARLQELTRDLDAAMVIDAETRASLPDGSDFEVQPAVEIRGRTDREDLYLLPLPERPSLPGPPESLGPPGGQRAGTPA